MSHMATTNYAQGTLIWIKHEEEVWAQAEIVTAGDKEIIVKTADDPNSRIVLGPNEPIFLRTLDVFTSEGLSVLDDLTQLTHLHEPAVLNSLENRFDIDKIYTFTGPILLAVNPFKTIRDLYTEEVLKSFLNRQSSGKPHVFSTSNSAFQGICDRGKSQTVLISGESGAGKTETTKYVMNFLALAGSSEGEVTNVENQVLASNPLLEAFGNARTLRNDNSSRFGKFIELQFQSRTPARIATGVVSGANARLCGARIQTYLLEKVRVCDQQEGERTYHIFYEACAASMSLPPGGNMEYAYPQILPAEKIKEPIVLALDGFGDLRNFAYLTRSTCTTLKEVNDVEMFERRIYAMQTIGICTEHIRSILQITAAVLHLGNTKFDAPANNSEGSQVMPECESCFSRAANLTGVDRNDLEKSICCLTRTVGMERMRSAVGVRQAADNRDALAKVLYGLVFNFIVEQSNQSIGYLEDVKLFVGVLDIFGFECFKMNSFEQLCINFTNERLQQFFNSFVFKLEEQLYNREGVEWDPLDFPDNQDAVDIMSARKGGIFSLLDDECMVPGGTDQSFCNKLIRASRGHRRFDEIKTKPTWFVIKHFAGPVPYCTDCFLDKNKEQTSHDIVECMLRSNVPFVKMLFETDKKFAAAKTDEQPTGGKKKQKLITVSSEFKDQLASLMDIVGTTEPHFIRCIKPNPQNEPDMYDRKSVTEQLRYGGVLQVVQVSRAGYPVRINHQECWDDYKVIASQSGIETIALEKDPKVRALKLLELLTSELNIPKPITGVPWAVGKTLVFFKQASYERFKFARLDLLVRSTTSIQAHWRRKVFRDMYKALLMCVQDLQALLCSKKARLDFLKLRQQAATVRVQAFVRMWSARKHFRKAVRMAIRIQAWYRSILGPRQHRERKMLLCVGKIQRMWRCCREYKMYHAALVGTYASQQRWRMYIAKKQLKKLRQEAMEVGVLMVKAQKSQEEAAELRKKNVDLEGIRVQMLNEKKVLKGNVKQLEDDLKEKENQLECARKKIEESVVLSATQVVVESKIISNLETQLSEKDAEILKLKEELQQKKQTEEKQQEALNAAEARYQQLLKSTVMASMVNMNPNTPAPHIGQGRTSKHAGNRNVDIQLVGLQNVGKTSLLESFIKDQDPGKFQRFVEQKQNLMSHLNLQLGDRMLRLLDCSGNVRAQHLVKEWFARSHWVFVVYNMSDQNSLDYALELTKDVSAMGARVLLFGNKWSADQGYPIRVDVATAKDCAVRHNGLAVEGLSLISAVRMALSTPEEPPAPEVVEPSAGQGDIDGFSSDMQKRSSISAAIDSVKSWFGGAGDKARFNQGVLRPSLKGTRSMRQQRREGDVSADLRPVQELQDSESAVTCVCFGQERLHKTYILLATASKDGTVVIYRCYRTEMESAMLADQDFPQDEDPAFTQPADNSHIAIHSRLMGHSRAITSIFFNLLEDQMVTTSIDKSVRFWGVDTGEMLKVFTDSSPVPVAAFLPFNPQVFVAANSNAVLRLVNVTNGIVLQKLKVETEVRALKFDDTGVFLLAGTKNGSIHVLEAFDTVALKFKFKVQLARGGVTCITFVPGAHGQPPCLLVNTSDSSATIIDCIYGPPAGVLTNLSVRHRVRVAHSLLPLKCCYSPSGQGYLISGSEDKEIYIYNLCKGSNYKMHYLKHHQVPVVAVAVNLQDTLLASADSLGRIVLWRRIDFSHFTD